MAIIIEAVVVCAIVYGGAWLIQTICRQIKNSKP